MPILHTQQFGAVEFDNEAIYHFPSGVPGFEEVRDFVFLQQPSTDPLMFMHSLLDPNLCFILLPIRVIDPDYRLHLSADDLIELSLPVEEQPVIGTDILCAAVVCAGKDAEGKEPTANLLAPVILNLHQRIGLQVIQTDSGYSCEHPVLAPREMFAC